MSKQFHLTAAFGETDGKCDTCGGKTVLVVAHSDWMTDSEESHDANIYDELTGHYCVKCGCLTSISFNQVPS